MHLAGHGARGYSAALQLLVERESRPHRRAAPTRRAAPRWKNLLCRSDRARSSRRCLADLVQPDGPGEHVRRHAVAAEDLQPEPILADHIARSGVGRLAFRHRLVRFQERGDRVALRFDTPAGEQGVEACYGLMALLERLLAPWIAHVAPRG